MSRKPARNESVIDIVEEQSETSSEHKKDHGEGSRNEANPSSSRTPRLSDTKTNDVAITSDNSTDSSPDGQLFSTNYVDQLVESFWTKIDQKIEDTVSQQSEAQKIQEQKLQNKMQEEEKKKGSAVEKYTEYYNFSYSFIYVIEFLLRIWTIFKRKVFGKAKTAVSFICSIPWRENLAKFLFHRHAHLVVFLLVVMDITSVLLIILKDFDIINEDGNGAVFEAFKIICFSILVCFVLEILLKIVSLGKDLLGDTLETFDCILVTLYFVAELVATRGFRTINETYPKYIHIIAILRLWRGIIVKNELFPPKDEMEGIE